MSNLTSLAFGGVSLVYGYNDRDDLSSLTADGGPPTAFSYDDARNRTDVDTPDGTNRHYIYDDANRVTSVANTTDSGTQTFVYTHDGNGNILSENATSYGYDALNRLTSWEHDGVTTSYRYDDAGNLLEVANDTIPVKSFSYNAANQITNTGFSYDANGNMTGDGDKTYIYDGDNRLIEVKEGASTIASYTYDYMGRRTSVTESGNTIYYHYDGWNVVAETNSSGATIATYAYDNTNQPISMTRDGQTYYYQTNAHGDVMTLTDSTGTVVNTYIYDPWGKVLSSSEAVSNPYRYAGYRYDEGTGLYYLQARYYSPSLSRFLTKDLADANLKTPKTLNKYIYCEDNPISQIDTNGHHSREIHYDMAYTAVKEIAMDYGYSEGFAKYMARIVATADRKSDAKFTGLKCRGQHLNTNMSFTDTSQGETAERFMQEAISPSHGLEMSLTYLGYGLHSIQDLAGHGTLPVVGAHIKVWTDADQLNESQMKIVKEATVSYIERYYSVMRYMDQI